MLFRMFKARGLWFSTSTATLRRSTPTWTPRSSIRCKRPRSARWSPGDFAIVDRRLMWQHKPTWYWLVVWNIFYFPIYDYMYIYIGNNPPNWLIFFRGVETTNQMISHDIIIWLAGAINYLRMSEQLQVNYDHLSRWMSFFPLLHLCWFIEGAHSTTAR